MLFLFASIGVVAGTGDNVARRRLLAPRRRLGFGYSPSNCMDDRGFRGDTCVVLCDGKDACDNRRINKPASNTVKSVIVRCTGLKDDVPCKGGISFPGGVDVYLMCLSGTCDGIDEEYLRDVDYQYCAPNECNSAGSSKNIDQVTTQQGVTVVVFNNKVTVGADPNNNKVVGVVVDCTGNWRQWGQCTQACGSGTQTRNYQVIDPGTTGGKPCDYSQDQQQSQTCNPQLCYGQPVVGWSVGWLVGVCAYVRVRVCVHVCSLRGHTHTPIIHNPYTHTPIHPHTHTPTTHTSIHPLHPYTHPPMHPSTHPPMHPCTHTPIRPYAHTPMHPCTHTRIHP